MDNKKGNITCFLIILSLAVAVDTQVYRPLIYNSNAASYSPFVFSNFQTTGQNLRTFNYNAISKVSLAGNYIIEVSGLPLVLGNADSSRFGFRGCNTNSFSYEAFSNGTFRVIGQPASTRIFC